MNKVIKRTDGILELIPDQQAQEVAAALLKHKEDLHLVSNGDADLKTLAEVMQHVLLRIRALENHQ